MKRDVMGPKDLILSGSSPSSALSGFDDRRRSALHACRYAFRSFNAQLEINDALICAIQGHRDKSTVRT
jgi:hypothetical protein